MAAPMAKAKRGRPRSQLVDRIQVRLSPEDRHLLERAGELEHRHASEILRLGGLELARKILARPSG